MDSFHVVTFYKIAYIDNFEKLGRAIERIGTKEKLSGTFFSTPQGVNATLSGSLLGLEKVIHLLNSYDLNIEPTWSEAKKTPFKRLKVKLKETLLPLDGDFDPVKRRGEHVEPSHWNKLITDHQPNVTVLTKKDLSSRQCRWMEIFQEFPLTWMYEKGVSNIADPLS